MNRRASLVIESQQVHIWKIRLSEFFDSIGLLENTLSSDEKMRAKRLKFDIDRKKFIVARAFLRKTLSLYLKRRDIEFLYNEHGKPYLQNHELYFNISHSNDVAILAIGTSELGVDIEEVKEFKEHIAKRFFTEEEYETLMALPENERVVAFYQLWTLKKALIKNIGASFFSEVRHLRLKLTEKQAVICRNLKIYLEVLNLDPNYQAAIASRVQFTNIVVKEW